MLLLALGCAVSPAQDDTAASPSYEEVAALFEVHCVRCHTHRESMYGGVELDTWEAANATRVKNACVSVSPERGRGLNCRGYAPLSMPPGATLRLSEEEQDLLMAWTLDGGRR